MTIAEALGNALELLETIGYRSGGGIHDGLEAALLTIREKHPKVAAEVLEEETD